MKTLLVKNLNFKKVADELKVGAVIAVATETVYGFSCDPSNQKAVEKIYKIKGRNFKKLLLLIADSYVTVKKKFKLNKKERELAEKYWPGALTIVLRIKEKSQKAKIKVCNQSNIYNVSSPLEGGDNGVAVRVSGNKVMRELAKECGGLITSASANLSGKKECLSGRAVFNQFKNRKFKPDFILDAGKLKTKKPSTIVKVEGKEVKILRQGEIEIKF